MPFKKTNKNLLKEEINTLTNNNNYLKETHEDFLREIELKELLINARNKEKYTQVELSNKTGLSQQAISRLERGVEKSNVKTLLRYLYGIGYKIEIKKI